MITLVAPGLAAAADVSGLVDIGGGRKMYLACSGVGSPTVVLISGKGNGAADWKESSILPIRLTMPTMMR